jgi:hypothetical protein
MTSEHSDSFNPCGAPKFFFKLTEESLVNSEIAFCATQDPLLHFSFPLDLLTPEKIVRLKEGLVLPEDMVLLRRNMLREVPVSELFIHAMLALYMLVDEIDYSDDTIKTISQTKNIPIREFVSAPGNCNLFFVMDFDLEDLTLSCIEVNSTKPIVINRAKLNVKQVSLSTWKGPQVPIEDYEAFFSADEHTFQSRVKEVEICTKPRDEHDEY